MEHGVENPCLGCETAKQRAIFWTSFWGHQASAGLQSVSGRAFPRELPECSHKPVPESFRKPNLHMQCVTHGLCYGRGSTHILLAVRLRPLSGCNSLKSFGTSAGPQHSSTRVRTRHFHVHRWQRPKTSPAPVSMQAILKHCGVWQHVVALVCNHMAAVFCCFLCSGLVVRCPHIEHGSQQALQIRSFVFGCPGSSVWKVQGGKFYV